MAQTSESAIRRLRRERGFTQKQLAARAGLSPLGLAKIDRGEAVPQRSTAVLLAAALSCRPSELREVKS